MISPEKAYAVCRLAVVPVRRFADMVSEMTSQVRFGEGVEILEENRGLWQVRLCSDDYCGWVDARQFTDPQPDPPPSANFLTKELAGWAVHHGERRLLPPGTPLPGLDGSNFWIGGEPWQWEGSVHPLPDSPDWTHLLTEADRYLNAPYLWGGRTVWGIDCSGLVQTLLGHQGVKIRRDCVLQVEDGTPVARLSGTRPGDLAFFDGTRDGGRHVGLVLANHKILHASGFVRIDDLTDRGIVVPETGHLSHRLTSLRRVAEWTGIGS